MAMTSNKSCGEWGENLGGDLMVAREPAAWILCRSRAHPPPKVRNLAWWKCTIFVGANTSRRRVQ